MKISQSRPRAARKSQAFGFTVLAGLVAGLMGACQQTTEPAQPRDLSTLPALPADLRSRFLVLYDGAPAPREVSPEQARELIDGMSDEWRAERLEWVGGDERLLPYFVADFDRDGRADWSFLSNFKMFIPYDLDFDNDGIENILDADPYDGIFEEGSAAPPDSDTDGIPDHLDWDVDNDTVPEDGRIDRRMVDLQSFLYRDAGVTAFNTNDLHDSWSLYVMYVAATQVYSPVFDAHGGIFPTWRYLGAQGEMAHFSARGWYDDDSRAIYLNPDFRKRRLSKHLTIGTAVHEIAHAFEHYLDTHHSPSPTLAFLGGLFEDGSFRGRTKDEWEARLKGVQTCEMGPGRTLLNRDEARSQAIVSIYGLTNPTEYFAESAEAYFHHILIDKMAEGMSGEARAAFILERNDMIERETSHRPENLSKQGYELFERFLAYSERIEFLEICDPESVVNDGDIRAN